jgi:hypothetical protein
MDDVPRRRCPEPDRGRGADLQGDGRREDAQGGRVAEWSDLLKTVVEGTEYLYGPGTIDQTEYSRRLKLIYDLEAPLSSPA